MKGTDELILHGWVEGPEQEEAEGNDQGQEESVIVENGEGGGFVVGDFVLLPQDPEQKPNKSALPPMPWTKQHLPFILFLLVHLLVFRHLLRDFPADRFLALHRNLVSDDHEVRISKMLRINQRRNVTLCFRTNFVFL